MKKDSSLHSGDRGGLLYLPLVIKADSSIISDWYHLIKLKARQDETASPEQRRESEGHIPSCVLLDEEQGEQGCVETPRDRAQCKSRSDSHVSHVSGSPLKYRQK